MVLFSKLECAIGRASVKSGLACFLIAPLAACASLGASGPSTREVGHATSQTVATAPIKIIEVTDAVARRVLIADRSKRFSETLGNAPPTGTIIGPGDVLQVNIWEAPPAVLFGSSTSFGVQSAAAIIAPSGVGQNTALPEMMVDDSGQIRVPFAGAVVAAGKTPHEVEREIIAKLTGKAHDPQVSVQIARNANADVTVVGDVTTSTRVPLTPKGERLLDVLATAGGVKQPIGKITVQIARNGQVAELPLETVIRDPAQNIRLGPNDVVTALYQPYSFTALGATNASAEVPFESTGISLSQALGRVGGLANDRADIRGVFIFRLENPAAVDPAIAATTPRTPDGRIPVIYRVDLRNPATFFAAQSFPIHNKDILYVSTAPLADLQRFVGMVSSMAFSVIGIGQAVP